VRLHFRRSSDAEAWKRADGRLVSMLELVQRYLRQEFGVYVLTVTSFYRPMDTGSPHSDYRAVDLRVRDLPAGAAQAVADWINSQFRYSASPESRYVVCLYGAYDPNGQHNDHIHLQVPPLSEVVAVRGRPTRSPLPGGS